MFGYFPSELRLLVLTLDLQLPHTLKVGFVQQWPGLISVLFISPLVARRNIFRLVWDFLGARDLCWKKLRKYPSTAPLFNHISSSKRTGGMSALLGLGIVSGRRLTREEEGLSRHFDFRNPALASSSKYGANAFGRSMQVCGCLSEQHNLHNGDSQAAA